jgi:uncharacterized RDD family membrane protein YckC
MSSPLAAPLWLRLAALGYDLLVLIAVWMLVAALVLLAFDGEVDVAHQPPLYHAVLQFALLLVTAAYFTLSWGRAGQTIGMRAWRLHLVDASGRRSPSMRKAALRFVVALASALAAGIGFLWCLFDREQRTWHDIAAGTRLERWPRSPR